MNLEGLRYTAAEFLPSDEVTLPGLWGWARGWRGTDFHQLFIYMEHLFCAVLHRIGNNNDRQSPRPFLFFFEQWTLDSFSFNRCLCDFQFVSPYSLFVSLSVSVGILKWMCLNLHVWLPVGYFTRGRMAYCGARHICNLYKIQQFTLQNNWMDVHLWCGARGLHYTSS